MLRCSRKLCLTTSRRMSGCSPPRSKLVVVLGPTGSGKSKLAIDLAVSLAATHQKPAEIINADALQVYKALPVLTAKVGLEEMREVPHHLMSFLDPAKGDEYVVHDFVKDAGNLIREMHANSKLPIIVGGTAYYVQHLIVPPQPYHQSKAEAESLADFQKNLANSDLASLLELLPTLPLISSPSSLPDDFPVQKLPTTLRDPEALAYALWQLLNECDSETAAKWHWRDVRKVRRQLELIYPELNGRPAVEQSQTKIDVPPFRTLLFWLYTEPETLNSRLDRRVDKMVEDGLIDEVGSVLASVDRGDFTRGITQAIGFKPFADYLSKESRSHAKFENAKERTQINTRQYAKKQTSWFKHKLLPAIQADPNIAVYALDTTKADDEWQNILDKATGLLHSFLSEEELPHPTSIFAGAAEILAPITKDAKVIKIICPICTTSEDRPVMIEEGEAWNLHEKSRRHQGLVKKARKMNSHNL